MKYLTSTKIHLKGEFGMKKYIVSFVSFVFFGLWTWNDYETIRKITRGGSVASEQLIQRMEIVGLISMGSFWILVALILFAIRRKIENKDKK